VTTPQQPADGSSPGALSSTPGAAAATLSVAPGTVSQVAAAGVPDRCIIAGSSLFSSCAVEIATAQKRFNISVDVIAPQVGEVLHPAFRLHSTRPSHDCERCDDCSIVHCAPAAGQRRHSHFLVTSCLSTRLVCHNSMVTACARMPLHLEPPLSCCCCCCCACAELHSTACRTRCHTRGSDSIHAASPGTPKCQLLHSSLQIPAAASLRLRTNCVRRCSALCRR
jgi:hypothetical protein